MLASAVHYLLIAIKYVAWYGPPLVALYFLVVGLRARERDILLRSAVALVCWPLLLVLSGLFSVLVTAWLNRM